MKKEDNNTDYIKDTDSEDFKIGSIKDILGGNVLTRKIVVKQLPYILFITVLAILYIANRYKSEKIVRETAKQQNMLKELRAESMTTASELMYHSRQSEVYKLLKDHHIDLKECVEPPKKIVVK
ncbi:MAG: FtsL-like putative cell division protein [Bacteroidota bacterium]|nr:FtsL-like putative cell division protein [Bacteroidota bacterium]MDP4226570.1 FtsL-like putative cell division protein [Bacteroidota bacterium]MDP4275181.1 FtsL-like putative cell division protein [Bacteroidota bacterium]